MKQLRLLLLPFAWIYGMITGVRNMLYNRGIFKSHSIKTPSICVGNLSVGGTGKTPHVDYLAHYFLSKNKKVATLSRGYGRSTKGVREVNLNSTSDEVGDEPLLYKTRYKDQLVVVVAERRKEGVEFIEQHYPETDIILLDDAFQHRAVKAHSNLLITDYAAPFSRDFVLPAGNLREWKSGKKRADAIIVSKCPTIEPAEKEAMIRELQMPSDRIYFSHIEYGEMIGFAKQSIPQVEDLLLVTGIANPQPLIDHLKTQYKITHLAFKDHHQFSTADIGQIHEKFDSFASRDKITVTTEKDYMRFKDLSAISDRKNEWFFIPISLRIDKQQQFNQFLDGHLE